MSACTRYPDDEAVLRYVTSDLVEPELSAFEDHLFACDACLARVERYQAAQEALTEWVLPTVPTAVPGTDTGGAASGPPRPAAWWVLGAVAASLLLAVAGWSAWRPAGVPAAVQVVQQPTPTPEATPAVGANSTALRVAVLAMVTPPPYLPITTRAGGDAGAFAQGMRAYVEADWAAASRALGTVATPEARFYQGVADLMRGDAPGAITSLDAARASGAQPYARESLFYLAKAALQRGDVVAARASLTAARNANAGPQGEAERLLEALDELGK
jgi:anti-sigma factor RsiW